MIIGCMMDCVKKISVHKNSAIIGQILCYHINLYGSIGVCNSTLLLRS